MNINDRVLGHTKVGWLNILLLQWLCFRLVMHYDDQTGEVTRLKRSQLILPGTGWFSSYIYLRWYEAVMVVLGEVALLLFILAEVGTLLLAF